jgi:chloramphenicol-sensitive protein RarD
MAHISPIPAAKNEDSLSGFFFALSAYLMWGFLPLYLKELAHIPAVEVIAHRILWSLPIAGAVLIAMQRTAELRVALRTPKMVGMAMVTAALISVNWGIYVWSIAAGRVLDTALGYYINPLFSILLGAVLLKELLAQAQKWAVALAAAAVLVLTVEAGRLPLISLSLMLSFGFYAYFKKSLPTGPNQGFFLEILVLSPFALGYVIYLQITGESHFLQGNGFDNWMLIGCGLVTAVPLMLYGNGARRLRMSTIGIMQYIAPTMIFVTAVFVFNEPFDLAKLFAFAMIWLALLIYSFSLLRTARRRRDDKGLQGRLI